MSKEKIILIHPSGSEQEFERSHAATLMGLGSRNGGWRWKNEADAAILETAKGAEAKKPCGCPDENTAQDATNDSTAKGSAGKPAKRRGDKGSRSARGKDTAA